MDGKRFDRITRALGGAPSRRSLLGLAAGLIAAPFAADQGAAGSARTRPQPEGPCGDRSRKDNACTKHSQCCTGFCSMKSAKKNKDRTGRCRCLKKGKPCTEDRNCCGRPCIDGKCGRIRRPAPPPPPACANCASGCCDGGTCVPYASQSAGQCGTNGAACAACSGSEACNGSGVCTLSSPSCDASSCASGCCDGTTCVAYASQSVGQCGTNGAACAACANGEDCTSGSCLLPPGCDAARCPDGCCNGTTCVLYADQSASQCGTGGAACAACTGSDACGASGVCTPTCGPSNCVGCCNGTTCVPFASQSNSLCGTNGATCAPCTGTCSNPGVCTSTNIPE